jgi:DNA-binding transcriptional regulator YdaS (Cro superfamily)
MTIETRFPALEEAIEWAGSLRKLAALMKRPPTTIHYWLSKGRIPRAEDALACSKAVGGRVSKKRLAPHAYSAPLGEQASKPAAE